MKSETHKPLVLTADGELPTDVAYSASESLLDLLNEVYFVNPANREYLIRRLKTTRGQQWRRYLLPRLLVFLLTLLVTLLILSPVFWVMNAERSTLSKLSDYGVTTTAKISAKDAQSTARGFTFYLTYTFEAGSQTILDTQVVGDKTYAAATVGDTIAIRYLPGIGGQKPVWRMLPLAEITLRDAAAPVLLIALPLSGIVFLLSLVTRVKRPNVGRIIKGKIAAIPNGEIYFEFQSPRGKALIGIYPLPPKRHRAQKQSPAVGQPVAVEYLPNGSVKLL